MLHLKDKINWWGPLALPDQLQHGKLYHTQWRKKRIVVVLNDEKLHAFEDRCPHQGVSFKGGECNGDAVICPFHKYAFRLNDGMGLSSPGQNLEMLEVEKQEDGIYVGTVYTTFSLFGIDLW